MFSSWLELGTCRAAALKHGVDDNLVRMWKSRHPEEWSAALHAHARAVSDRRQAIAKDCADGMHVAAMQIRKRLANAESLDAKELAALTRALATIDGNTDRILRLDAGTATEIVAAAPMTAEQAAAERAALADERAVLKESLTELFAEHPEIRAEVAKALLAGEAA